MRLARKQAIALARIWEWKTHIAMLLAGLVGISIGVWFDRVVLLHREGQPSGLLTFASIMNCEPPPPPPPPCECPKADLSAALPPTPLRAEDSPLVSSCDGALSLEDVFRHDASLRPQPRVPDAASVCMVVRTFEGHRNKLMVLLSTVLLWDHPALTIYLLDTGKGDAFTALPDVANMTSRIAGRPGAVRVSHWRNAESRAAFPQLGDIEDHGYIATDLTIDDILAMRQAARDAGTPPAELPCDTLIITNGDNLYGFEYLSATQEAMRAGAVMVNTHWVAHYDMKKEWILGWGEVGAATDARILHISRVEIASRAYFRCVSCMECCRFKTVIAALGDPGATAKWRRAPSLSAVAWTWAWCRSRPVCSRSTGIDSSWTACA